MVLDFKVNARLVVGMTINFFLPLFYPFLPPKNTHTKAPNLKTESSSPPPKKHKKKPATTKQKAPPSKKTASRHPNSKPPGTKTETFTPLLGGSDFKTFAYVAKND